MHQRRARVHRDAGHDSAHRAFRLIEQSREQVGRFDGLVVEFLGQVLGIQDGFLRFLGVFFEVHNRCSLPVISLATNLTN